MYLKPKPLRRPTILVKIKGLWKLIEGVLGHVRLKPQTEHPQISLKGTVYYVTAIRFQ